MSLVRRATRKGDLDRVKAAVSGGEDIDGRNSYGNTALHEACWHGRVDIVKYLLDNGANQELKGTNNWTPLQVACREGKVAIVQTLLDYGVDLNHPFHKAAIDYRETPLQLACQYGDVAILQTLLNHGMDLNQPFNEAAINNGRTPLQRACKFKRKEVIETLLDHALDNGYVTKVLKLCEHDENVGHNYYVRKKMGLNQIVKDDALFNESYQEALKDGSASNDRIPVMIIGQDRSGKTSLRKRLLGLPFDPNESSTVGIHVDLVRVTSETSKEPWQPTTDERILTSKDVAMQKVNEKAGMVLKQKTKYKQVQTTPLSTYNLKDTFHANQQSQQHHLPMDETTSVTRNSCHQEDPSKQQTNSDPIPKQQRSIESNATTPIQASCEQDQQIGNLASTTMAFNKQHMLISGVAAEPQLTDVIPSSDAWLNQEYTFATDVFTSKQQEGKSTRKRKSAEKPSRIEKELMTCYQDVNKDQKSDGVRILLHDLAGQAIYYDTHYLFLKSQAPYILIHDLTKDLDETAEPRFKPRFKVELNLGNPLLQNNLDYLLCWLSVLRQLGETEKDKSEEFSDFVLPPVVIVLTNEDQFEGDVEAVKRRIRDVTEGKYQNVFRNLYVIDNTTTSGNNDPVTALREKIFSICNEILAKEPPMPMKWLKFEGALSEKAFSGEKCNYISIDKAKKIAKKCNIHSFVDALKFLHRQGVVVYYEECPYVVLNPPWLMNLFTEIITVPEDSGNIKPKDAPYYRKLREKGVLMQKFLTKHPHGDLLENVMQQVSLMCPLKHEGKPAFLVPSVAPFMEKGQDIMSKLKVSPISSLFIMFLVGFIPLGVFTRFQVKLVNMCKGILRIDEPKLFCNYTLLPITFASIKFDVYLIQLIEKIKIGVCPKDETTNKESHAEFACHLKKLLEMCLEEIKSDEPLFYRGLRYEFGVKCSACVDLSNEYPCRHGKLKCEHDECGHMHSLNEIQDCSDDTLCCDSNPTEILEFDLERVKPWICTVPDKFTSANLKQSKDHSSAKIHFVKRIIYKAVRKTPFHRDRSQVEHELSGKKKKRAYESETMFQDEEMNSFSDDHESQPDLTDNEDNLLGNVSSCFNSLDIKQDFRVEILQEQENKQSRKRQNNTTDKENEASTSKEYVTATEDRRHPSEKVSVRNLNALVMLQLGKKLDVKKSVGGDYRYLAAYFDMSTEDIDLISEKDDRTKEVLSYVGRDPTNTVSKLRKILVEMERDDCGNY